MAAQSISRKRPAPGTSPPTYHQPVPTNMNGYSDGLGPQLSDDQFLQWGQAAQPSNSYQDPTNYNLPSNAYPQNNAQPSTQLTRRPFNQIVPTGRPGSNMNNSQWMDGSGGNVQLDGAWGDDIEELERKAQVAKQEAQKRRKQIPPFVQKLNSFLEDGRNTDLIRWSDEGNSFIVLDEDEFAKTLIPELFKHNNYASFVRQLNMYGFHKKVGLSDNSMRASERKNKSPSEYANPYFRRGHPELLWLIQKPKNAAASKLPKGKVKTEEEEAEEELVNSTFDFSDANYAKARPQLTAGQELTTLSQEQFETVQRELATIKQSQAQIAKMMAGLRREHEQLYGQAVTFQDQHNRHENSINAILTFLATVYNRSLQGQEGVVPGIANLFQNSIPGEGATGNIVDVGDFNLDGTDLGKMYKKQPLLLKAAPEPGPSESPATVSPGPSGSSYQGRQTRRMSQVLQGSASPGSGSVQEVFDSNVNTPYSPGAASQGRSQRDMMSVIQNANAQNSTPGTPAADFSNVLNSLENSGGRSPLTSSQRADMLRLMNNQGVGNERSNNALVNATPPSMPTNYDRNLASAKADLDNLAKLQADQEQSVQNLTSLLQPLSPTGSIPGLGDGLDIAPPPLDIDAFLSNGDYFQDFPTEGNNFETNGTTFPPFDGADEEELFANLPTTSEGVDGSQQGRVESVPSSEATTPQTIGEANFDAGSVASNGPTTRGKGRRISEAMDATDSPKRRRRNGAN